MAKQSIKQTDFTSGELSPKLHQRSDIQHYPRGVKQGINVVAQAHGGMRRRPGFRFAKEVKTSADVTRVMPYIVSRTTAYMLEFGNNYVRVYTADGTYTGVELVSPYASSQVMDLDYCQTGDVMVITGGGTFPQRLKSYSSSSWELINYPFVVQPTAETGHRPATGLTLGATSGTTSATAGAAAFLPCDVGRQIVNEAGVGIGTITGYTSTTVVTLTITTTFAGTSLSSGAWAIDVSPYAFLRPSAKDPVGGVITLASAQTRAATLTLTAKTGAITINASAGVFVAGDTGKVLYADGGQVTLTYVSATQCTGTTTTDFANTSYPTGTWGISQDAFRTTDDLGKFVSINGGLAKITSFTSAQIAVATIVVASSSLVAAPPLSWQLLAPAWSSTFGYPRTCTFHEQRLLFAGTTKFPQTIWASRLGITGSQVYDYTPGALETDAWTYTIASDEQNQILYLQTGRVLIAHTYGGPISLQAPAGRVISPLQPPSVRTESSHGCTNVRPVLSGKSIVYVQRTGRKVRAMGYDLSQDGYLAKEISVLSEHITKAKIVSMCWAGEPDQVLWCALADGAMVSATIDDDQNVLAWTKHYTSGWVESIACMPTAAGEQVWAVVRRRINGATKRYVEWLDQDWAPIYPVTPDPLDEPPITEVIEYGTCMDCAVVVDNGSGQTNFTGLGHLEGRTVEVVADGIDIGTFTVSGSQITIPRASYRTMIGLPFATPPTVQLLTPETGTPENSSANNQMRMGQVAVELYKTLGCAVIDKEGRQQLLPFTSFGPGLLDVAIPLFTGSKLANVNGWERGRCELTITQPFSMPFHLLAVARDITSN